MSNETINPDAPSSLIALDVVVPNWIPSGPITESAVSAEGFAATNGAGTLICACIKYAPLWPTR